MINLTVNFHGHKVALTIDDQISCSDAYTYGLTENCFPAKPREFELKINTDNELLNWLLEEEYIDEVTELAFESLEADSWKRATEAWEEENDCN